MSWLLTFDDPIHQYTNKLKMTLDKHTKKCFIERFVPVLYRCAEYSYSFHFWCEKAFTFANNRTFCY